MAGMTRKRIAVAVALALIALGVTGCENKLLSFLFDDLFYTGWKVASWSTPAPVVANYTHEQGEAYRNGYPLNMAMGSNGKIHLIGWRVSGPPHEWLYTVRQPGAAVFDQSYTGIASITNPAPTGVMPGIDLISDDAPIISFASSSNVLYYQEYIPNAWRSAEALYTAAASITYPSVVFLSTDFRPHLFYVSGGKLYHTARTGTGSISPNPPAVYIDDVSAVAVRRQGSGEVHFLYTDSARQNLYHRRYTGASPSTVWSAGDSSLSIGEIGMTLDSDGALHACVGTYKTADNLNPAFYTLHYLSNESGAWEAKGSITGGSTSGPLPWVFPASIAVAKHRHGNDRVHLAYTVYVPPLTSSIWYAYYDDDGWQKSETSLDTVHTTSSLTFPVLAVDADGSVHVVYSWAASELDRTMMYVKGTPTESQN